MDKIIHFLFEKRTITSFKLHEKSLKVSQILLKQRKGECLVSLQHLDDSHNGLSNAVNEPFS